MYKQDIFDFLCPLHVLATILMSTERIFPFRLLELFYLCETKGE
jgi:hypothetical protein